MSENRHIPVLLSEVLDALGPVAQKPDQTIVDCTLGGAGHSFAMLQKFPNVSVLGCDMDINAINAARSERLNTFQDKGRVRFYHGNFRQLIDLAPNTFEAQFAPPWSGILMDLGYSSNQLEDPEYGMSFMVNGPLDMRLAGRDSGQSAWNLLNECSAQELADIFKAYGEMPLAGRIARKLSEAVQSGEVRDSTKSLADFLERISGRREHGDIHPATLVFQALRIAVNDELRVLAEFLDGAILKLRPGGRIAIITFHSLEDRIVKRWGQKNSDQLTALTKKPVVAGSEEIKANPRARSAKLRVYTREGTNT